MKLSSKLCICGKQPNYNLQGLTPKFCSECKPFDAVDVKHKYCIENYENSELLEVIELCYDKYI
jgi:hypothetical protein